MRLNRIFFNRTTALVARELLGKFLCRRIGGRVIKLRITETEAYCGTRDKACHASKGLTERTKIMFGPPGHAYIYMIYGMYHCLNFVTGRQGYPAAVLIRGCELVRKYELRSMNNRKNSENHTSKFLLYNSKLNGPGKLCKALKIDRKLNGADLISGKDIWVEDSGIKIKNSEIKRAKRIGIDYAGEWKDKMWRFVI